MSATVQARVGVDVVAGILPGQANEEVARMRQWFITSEEWNAADDTGRAELLCDLAGKASAYATFLMLQPDRLNWVKVEWVWF